MRLVAPCSMLPALCGVVLLCCCPVVHCLCSCIHQPDRIQPKSGVGFSVSECPLLASRASLEMRCDQLDLAALKLWLQVHNVADESVRRENPRVRIPPIIFHSPVAHEHH